MELIDRNLQDYTQLVRALMPIGRLWEVALSASTKLSALLEVIANELLSVETRIKDLIDELIPDTTNELVPRWESILGLPDACTGVLPTLQQRVAAIVGKLFLLGATRGTLSNQFYIDLAARNGYTITITFLSANNWQVNAQNTAITYFKAGVSKTGEKIQTSGNDLLECVINKAKPAHTIVTYSYT